MNEIEKTVADKEMRIKTLLVDIIGFLPMQICQNMMMFGENKLAENQAKDVRSKARNQKDQMNDIIVDFCTKCLKDPDTIIKWIKDNKENELLKDSLSFRCLIDLIK